MWKPEAMQQHEQRFWQPQHLQGCGSRVMIGGVQADLPEGAHITSACQAHPLDDLASPEVPGQNQPHELPPDQSQPHQVLVKPVVPASQSQPPQFLAKPVVPPSQSQPPQFLTKPVVPPSQSQPPQFLAKPVVPPSQSQVLAKPVVPPSQSQPQETSAQLVDICTELPSQALEAEPMTNPSHNLEQFLADEQAPSEVKHSHQANPGTQPAASHHGMTEAPAKAVQQTAAVGVQSKLDIQQLEQRAATSSAARTKLALMRGKEMFRSRVAEAQEKQCVEQPQQPVATPVRSQHLVNGLPGLCGKGAGESSQHSGGECSDATHVYEAGTGDVDEDSDGESNSCIMSVSLSIRGDEDEDDAARALAAEEMAEFLGKPPGFGQKVEDFLSPEMQEAPKPRGRKKGKACKKRGRKRRLATADEAPKRKRAKPSGRKPKASSKPKPEPKKACKGATKAKAKAKSKATAKSKAAATAVPKTKTARAKAKAKGKPYRSPCLDLPEYKAKQSRKSAAYHRALKEARDQGRTIPECRELARQAAGLILYMGASMC